MLYAKSLDGKKVLPAKDIDAVCPMCGESLIAKMGKIKTHHWSHRSDTDCDTFSEGETEWHRRWKLKSLPEFTEVTITKGGIVHRADIVGYDDLVIELQHSPISVRDIQAREDFYDNMVWVLDASDFNVCDEGKTLNGARAMKWNYAKVSFTHARKPIFLDLGLGSMFKITESSWSFKYLSGYYVPRDTFCLEYIIASTSDYTTSKEYKSLLDAMKKKSAESAERHRDAISELTNLYNTLNELETSPITEETTKQFWDLYNNFKDSLQDARYGVGYGGLSWAETQPLFRSSKYFIRYVASKRAFN